MMKAGKKRRKSRKGKKRLLLFSAIMATMCAASFIYWSGNRASLFPEEPCNAPNAWTTIDEFQYAQGRQSSPDAMMSDKEGNIYLAGIAWEGSNRYWIVRRSAPDRQEGWETSDIYMSESSALGAMAFGMGQDSLGNYYAAGADGIVMEAKPYYLNHWIVRMSPDGKPGSWKTVDDFLFNDKAGAVARGISADSSGNIYAAGEGYEKFGNSFWIVRKGSAYDNDSWKTVDEFQFEGASSSPTQIAVDPFSNIFVIGSGNKKWLVRKSEDKGESWTTLDSYQYRAGKSSYPSDISFNQSGQIYVAGQGLDEKDSNHWIVRKSEDFGLTWKTVDDYQFEAGQHSYSNAIIVIHNQTKSMCIIYYFYSSSVGFGKLLVVTAYR